MRTLKIELTFLDEAGNHHYRIIEMRGDSISDVAGAVATIISSYESNNLSYVGSTLLEVSGEQEKEDPV